MYTNKLNDEVKENLSNVNYLFLIPALVLLSCFLLYFLFTEGGFKNEYIGVQKNLFYYLNHKLSQFPSLQFNLTQLGDVLISFSLLSILIVYAPKFWQALLTSSILSLIVSVTLKSLFAVPRPAAIFNNESFNIIGETLTGKTSLPSGHSIAAFVVITTVLFAFLPKHGKTRKIVWTIGVLLFGLSIAFSRVGVGAHYPFDVIIGSSIGYVVAILGIKINAKLKWLNWVGIKKYHPVFILLLVACGVLILKKIPDANLFIFYLSLISLSVALFTITRSYFKK